MYKSIWFTSKKMGFYGQFETDKYIAQYFPEGYKGTCIEVGMGEPVNGSNTYWFEQRGWGCLCIEPNIKYCRQARNIRRKVENVACGAEDLDNQPFTIINIVNNNESAISSLKIDDRLIQDHKNLINYAITKSINVRKLDTVLEQHPWITDIDFISIDTENTELDVIKGFNINRWRPKLLIIENNYDDPSIGEYLKSFGYIREKRIEVNDFYLRMPYQKFHGEIQLEKHADAILREYFPDYNYKGIFFDVGAYEPVNISNSYHFEQNGWNVYCFEANTALIPQLKKMRKHVYNYAIYDENKDAITFNIVHGIWGGGSLTAGCSAIELDPSYLKEFGKDIVKLEHIQIPQRTLDDIIEKEIRVDHIDILQIDVEGGELKVLKGLNIKKYAPKVILVEDIFNNSQLHNYIIQHGYRLDKHISYNKYYIQTHD